MVLIEKLMLVHVTGLSSKHVFLDRMSDAA